VSAPGVAMEERSPLQEADVGENGGREKTCNQPDKPKGSCSDLRIISAVREMIPNTMPRGQCQYPTAVPATHLSDC
jgi:hypothetical protein